jgi:RNA polymerase sigma-70 factor (ECF subfamily)
MQLNDYNACVNQWADALFRFALKHSGNREDARDIVQSSFEVLWQKRKEVDFAKGKAFLFQVAYNLGVSAYRKKKESHINLVTENSPVADRHYPDLKRLLDKALLQLDEEARALVLLKDLEGYSYDEIANISGLNETQVKVYLHRARKILKNYLVSVERII